MKNWTVQILVGCIIGLVISFFWTGVKQDRVNKAFIDSLVSVTVRLVEIEGELIEKEILNDDDTYRFRRKTNDYEHGHRRDCR